MDSFWNIMGVVRRLFKNVRLYFFALYSIAMAAHIADVTKNYLQYNTRVLIEFNTETRIRVPSFSLCLSIKHIFELYKFPQLRLELEEICPSSKMSGYDYLNCMYASVNVQVGEWLRSIPDFRT